MQASLPQGPVPIGASTLLAVISTSFAVFNAVAQAVFQKRIQINLERFFTPGYCAGNHQRRRIQLWIPTHAGEVAFTRSCLQ
ncbi:hypothetical protein F5B21DRAFT_479467 [Xylaria acuta]|nr:hypothetical protein F5B21DRAFT_479467 [Xylaria acuta]